MIIAVFFFKLPFNGAGFAFGDELPLLLKALIRTNDNCGFLFKLPFDGTVGCSLSQRGGPKENDKPPA